MPKRPSITTNEGEHPEYSSIGGTQSITTTTSSEDFSLSKTFAVINQMVKDGIIKAYALGGAMGAFFYVEPDTTYDMDMFCTLAYEMEGNALILLDPIIDYLKDKGYEAHGIGVMIEGTEVQFQFPSDSLGQASIQTAHTTDFQGVPVKVMTPEYLVAHMLKTGRLKDKTRVARFIETGAFDPAILSAILAEHGLEEKWAILEQLDKQISE